VDAGHPVKEATHDTPLWRFEASCSEHLPLRGWRGAVVVLLSTFTSGCGPAKANGEHSIYYMSTRNLNKHYLLSLGTEVLFLAGEARDYAIETKVDKS
jgi:hypothetical protein